MIINFKTAITKRKKKNQFLIDQIRSSIETHVCKLATHAIWLCGDQYTAELALQKTANQFNKNVATIKNLEQLQNEIYLELKEQCVQLCTLEPAEIRKPTSQFSNAKLIHALKEVPEGFSEPLAMQAISRLHNSDIMRFLGISEQELMRRLRTARERLFTITNYSRIAKKPFNNPLSA